MLEKYSIQYSILISLSIALVILATPQSFADTAPVSIASFAMRGTNMNLLVTPLPFNPNTDKNVTLLFIPNYNESELVPNHRTVKQLDYNITISMDGNDVFYHQFHANNGFLTLVFSPSPGQISVTGGMSDVQKETTGSFYINGPVFNNTGNYEISAQVVGVYHKPINPLGDKFTVQTIPEFGSMIGIVSIFSIIGVIMVSRKFGFYGN